MKNTFARTLRTALPLAALGLLAAAPEAQLGEPMLTPVRGMIAASTGGFQTLSLNAGPQHAADLYLTLGSVSGTWPGFVIDDKRVFLNPDGYTVKTLLNPFPPLGNSIGVLSSEGRTQVRFFVAKHLAPQLVGLTFAHAVLVFDADTKTLALVSSPAEVLIAAY